MTHAHCIWYKLFLFEYFGARHGPRLSNHRQITNGWEQCFPRQQQN
uniref:Uncharacterized protein n=1 Tax=mine drainage metagenome TaxID=410659 RepID=E6QSN9_9ZZZZ